MKTLPLHDALLGHQCNSNTKSPPTLLSTLTAVAVAICSPGVAPINNLTADFHRTLLESEVGKGGKFKFTLPIDATPASRSEFKKIKKFRHPQIKNCKYQDILISFSSRQIETEKRQHNSCNYNMLSRNSSQAK